jgi:ABC-2 type transport system ATP-binding protein
MERFGLAEWKNRKVSELSKGMAQKAQFIGAIAHHPSVVLFDEPFSGLDPLAQDELLAVMVELKQKGTMVLFSTHIMEHAEKICERILLVNKGKEVVYGPMADIKAKYGRNAVQLEFDGDGSFVKDLDFVASVAAYPRWIEVELKEGTDPDLLFAAVAGRLRMRRFETVSPSLHKIFVRLVGGEANDA